MCEFQSGGTPASSNPVTSVSVAGETIVRLEARLWFVPWHRALTAARHGRGRSRRTHQRRRQQRTRSRAQPGDRALSSKLHERSTGCGPDRRRLERLYTTTPPTWVPWPTTSATRWQPSIRCASRENLLRRNAAVTSHRLLRGAIRGRGCAACAARPPTEACGRSPSISPRSPPDAGQLGGLRPLRRRPPCCTPTTPAPGLPGLCCPSPA